MSIYNNYIRINNSIINMSNVCAVVLKDNFIYVSYIGGGDGSISCDNKEAAQECFEAFVTSIKSTCK